MNDDAERRKWLPPEIGCKGKVAFDSFGRANSVLKRPGHNDRIARQAYRCVHCGKWHIGTNTRRSAKRLRIKR